MVIFIRELQLLTRLSLNTSSFTDCPYPLQTGKQEITSFSCVPFSAQHGSCCILSILENYSGTELFKIDDSNLRSLKLWEFCLLLRLKHHCPQNSPGV